MRSIRNLAATFATLTLLAASAYADTQPTSRIVRLTSAEGYVRIDRHDSSPGDPAQPNMPLVEGQTIITGENGQAELEFEDGSVARVTPNTSLTLSHLGVDASSLSSRISLKKGLAYFELRSAPNFAYTVDAGGDIITPAENTSIRVTMDEAPAAVAVMLGAAHVERADSYKVDIQAGQTFRSDIDNAGRYFMTQEIAPDTWDQWNEARDQAAADTAPRRTAARDGFAGSQGYGWSDLDANGSWYNVAGQGQVWQPTEGDSADFDPYDNGSWMWYPGGGYLWASSYSWGWTPFRCGNWSFWNSFGWGWSPNGGCGGLGFAGYGGYGYGGGYGGYGGGYVNVVLPPRRYPTHKPLPIGGHPGGGVHPIISVHTAGLAPFRPIARPQPGQIRIAGAFATPLRPIGHSYTPRGGSALGASLRSDYPVDRDTHAPILGAQTNHPGPVIGFMQGTTPAASRAGSATAGFRAAPQSGIQRSAQPEVQQGYRSTMQPALRPSGPANSFNNQQQTGQRSSVPIQGSQQRNTAPAQSAQPHYAAPAPSFSAPMSHSAPAAAPSGGARPK